jgi:hypothetical protein
MADIQANIETIGDAEQSACLYSHSHITSFVIGAGELDACSSLKSRNHLLSLTTSVGDAGQSACLYSYSHVNSFITSVGEIDQCSPTYSRNHPVSYLTSGREAMQVSCLFTGRINILKAYTQSITVIMEKRRAI